MVYTLNTIEIGKIIKELRLKQGLSQQALAKGSVRNLISATLKMGERYHLALYYTYCPKIKSKCKIFI